MEKMMMMIMMTIIVATEWQLPHIPQTFSLLEGCKCKYRA